MGKIIKLILFLVIASATYYGYELHKLANSYVAVSSKIIPMLNDVTKNWSYLSLKKHLDPVGYDGRQEDYNKMLSKASHLGKFETCENMTIGEPTGIKLEGLKGVAGDCNFENGSAKLTVLFMEQGGETTLISMVLEET